MNFTRISVLEARLLLETFGGERAQIAVIRDELAYNDAHIENAVLSSASASNLGQHQKLHGEGLC